MSHISLFPFFLSILFFKKISFINLKMSYLIIYIQFRIIVNFKSSDTVKSHVTCANCRLFTHAWWILHYITSAYFCCTSMKHWNLPRHWMTATLVLLFVMDRAHLESFFSLKEDEEEEEEEDINSRFKKNFIRNTLPIVHFLHFSQLYSIY